MGQTATVIIFLLSGSLAVVGNTLLKSGMNNIGGFEILADSFIPTILKFASNWKIIGGFALYGASSFLYLKLLSSIEVTKIYPMLVAYMFIVLLLFGAFFLKESMTAAKVVGIAVIILGVFLASR